MSRVVSLIFVISRPAILGIIESRAHLRDRRLDDSLRDTLGDTRADSTLYTTG